MISKILAVTAVSLSLGTAAIAQTSTEGNSSSSTITLETPSGWEGPVNDAFFIDGTLRTEEEVRTGWATLSAEQQAMVRADCDTFATASAPDTPEVVPGTGAVSAADSGAGGTSGASDESGGTDAGTTASTTDSSSAIAVDDSTRQLCGWIAGM